MSLSCCRGFSLIQTCLRLFVLNLLRVTRKLANPNSSPHQLQHLIRQLCILCLVVSFLLFWAHLKHDSLRVWYLFWNNFSGPSDFFTALGNPFFAGAPELWPSPLTYTGGGGGAELPGLQAPTMVHPALHPQVPLRSFFWHSPTT